MTGIINHNLGLSEEDLEKLEKLAGIGYSNDDIARFFNIDVNLFNHIASDPTTNINYRIEAGKFKALANESLALLAKAEKGDVKASKQIHEIRRTRGFKISSMDIFGSMDKKAFEALEDWIQNGAKSELKSDEKVYLDALSLMHSLDRKYGRRNAVNFFVKTYNLPHRKASDLYDESVNLFYSDRSVEKKALRIKNAELLEDYARAVATNATTARDFEVAANIIVQASKLRGLDKPDIEKLPASNYRKPVRVFSLDPSVIGLPQINRNELARQIDSLEIPESEKIRLKKDATIEPIVLESYLDELETENK